jgi:hypothetical protein
MAHPVHIVMTGQHVYGMVLDCTTVFMTIEQIQALDEMINVADGTPVTVDQGNALRAFVRQALGLTEVIKSRQNNAR